MVRLQLSIKAELENVTNLQPDKDSFDYFFQVKCTSCNEVHSKLVALNRLEEHEVSGGKGGTAHFIWKCRFCKRESSAKLDSSPVRPYTADSNSQFAPLLIVECRGLEFTGFDPRGLWRCEGLESGTKFSEIPFETQVEWVDYDEKVQYYTNLVPYYHNTDNKPPRLPNLFPLWTWWDNGLVHPE